MEEYEKQIYMEKLVKLINDSENMCSSGDIAGWLDKVPSIASTCLTLYQDTNDSKYKDILLSVIKSIDALMCDAVKKASLADKEKHNILRLKLYNILRHFDNND
jgi:hypothetical protein